MTKITKELLLLIISVLTLKRKRFFKHRNKKNRRNVITLYKLYLQMKVDERKNRKYWVRNIFQEKQREGQGASTNLVREMYESDEERYFNFLRMPKATFEELLGIVQSSITKHSFIRESINPTIRLQITLRYLASGDSMVSMQYLFRVGKNTISMIIAEICEAIWVNLKDMVFMKPTPENWKQIAKGFEEKWNFKNCIGAIDGKHVVMQALPNSGSTYYNYKGSHSYVLLAIADADYKFIMVDIGGEGRQSDSGILKNSKIGQGFELNMFNVPATENNLPYVLIGDEAFPLTHYMMRPYPRRTHLDLRKKVFNYRLSRARRVVENAFGILVARWRIFRKPIIAGASTIKKITQATVCLHNFLLIRKKSLSRESNSTTPTSMDLRENLSDGLQDISRLGTNTFSRRANTIRENLTDYFCNTGAVEWQWAKALQNDF